MLNVKLFYLVISFFFTSDWIKLIYIILLITVADYMAIYFFCITAYWNHKKNVLFVLILLVLAYMFLIKSFIITSIFVFVFVEKFIICFLASPEVPNPLKGMVKKR